ncbi:MAG: hypothetical protein L6R39_003096 [Caloplaca ligustica]|nr:MAG: hypothetical protein L6R39_003096 [Caloplaca ligustica]
MEAGGLVLRYVQPAIPTPKLSAAMASHSLAIAKASLAASLMRPEPSPVPRADIAHFHRLVDTLLSQCTLCKDWLLKNTTSSPARTGAVGKYLVALSASLASPRSPNRSDQAKAMKPSNKRRQLSILYLLHDVLHHTKFHCPASAETAGSDRMLEPYVMQLVALTSAHEPTKHAQHIRKLKDLIDIWSAGEYYPSPLIAALRMTVNDALNGKRDVLTGDVESLQRLGTLEEAGSDGRRAAPYVMPPAHGDNSVPYYDLPAGDLMPCIVPNSTTPIDPRMVKPLEFRAGPADEGLVQAVKSLLQDAATIYGTPRPWYEMEKSDIDELGQLVIQDEFPREASVSEGYYGWSRAFCERMKLRNKRGNVPRHPHRYEYTTA